MIGPDSEGVFKNVVFPMKFREVSSQKLSTKIVNRTLQR